MPSFTLKALVSDHSLLFHNWSLTRAHSRKQPALVATTFLNSRGGRLQAESFDCAYYVGSFRLSYDLKSLLCGTQTFGPIMSGLGDGVDTIGVGDWCIFNVVQLMILIVFLIGRSITRIQVK